MVISEKCSRCAHDKICSFKNEYLAACKAVKNASYSTRTEEQDGRMGIMQLKNSTVSISVKCPYMMAQTDFCGSMLQLQGGYSGYGLD